jgi:hypothetical protein
MSAEPSEGLRPELRLVDGKEPGIDELRHLLGEERMRRMDAERDLAKKRRRITFLENELAGHHADRRMKDPNYDFAVRCCRYWRDKVSPRARKYDSPERLQPVLDRLNDRCPDTDDPVFDPRYVCEAIVGAAVDPWVINGDVLKDISIICKSARNLQSFHDRYERWKQNGAVRH